MKQTNHNFMSAALKLQTIFPSLNKATIYQGCKLEPSRGFKGGNIIWNVLSRIATGVKDNPTKLGSWRFLHTRGQWSGPRASNEQQGFRWIRRDTLRKTRVDSGLCLEGYQEKKIISRYISSTFSKDILAKEGFKDTVTVCRGEKCIIKSMKGRP